MLRHKLERDINAEEGASIRAVRASMRRAAGIAFDGCARAEGGSSRSPTGSAEGDREAAVEAFRRMGEVAGDAISECLTLIDGLVVIGGGISGAHRQFLPAIVDETEWHLCRPERGAVPSGSFPRAFNLEDPAQLEHVPQRRDERVEGPGQLQDRSVRRPATHGSRNLAARDERGDRHRRVRVRAAGWRNSDDSHRIFLDFYLGYGVLGAQEFNRGVGVYPGDPTEDWAPALKTAIQRRTATWRCGGRLSLEQPTTTT